MRNFHPLMLCATLAVLALLSGCASTAPSPSEGARYLDDYAKLSSQGALRSRFLGWASPTAAVSRPHAVYVAPVSRFPATATFASVDPAVVEQVLALAEARLKAQLTGGLQVVDEPAQADTLITVALTGIGPAPEGKTVLDLLPFRLVTAPLKNAVFGEPLEASARLEVRVEDARTHALLRESLHALAGKGIGRSGSESTHVTVDSLRPAVDSWAETVAGWLVSTS